MSILACHQDSQRAFLDTEIDRAIAEELPVQLHRDGLIALDP
jgi:hypothetical protein